MKCCISRECNTRVILRFIMQCSAKETDLQVLSHAALAYAVPSTTRTLPFFPFADAYETCQRRSKVQDSKENTDSPYVKEWLPKGYTWSRRKRADNLRPWELKGKKIQSWQTKRGKRREWSSRFYLLGPLPLSNFVWYFSAVCPSCLLFAQTVSVLEKNGLELVFKIHTETNTNGNEIR